MNKFFSSSAAMLVAGFVLFSQSPAWAHMAWLATDADDHAIVWFGESPTDRTYHLPEGIAAIELMSANAAASVLKIKKLDTDSFVGLRSESKVKGNEELFGTVTYGLYHGTKLTYHVEHLPGSDAKSWPSEPRGSAALQSVIVAAKDGGVDVLVLQNGAPAKDLEVKLYCEEGHEEDVQKTDAQGRVSFAKNKVESGLNAVTVMVNSATETGEFDGEKYTGSTEILTATFFHGEKKPAVDAAAEKSGPKVDPNSGVTIVSAELPEFPEELTSFGATIAGDMIYAYGGHTGSAHSYSTAEQSNRLWCLDTSEGGNGQWKELATGPRVQGLGLVAFNNKIIRIGGFSAVNAEGEDHDLRSQDSVAVFDPATKVWTELPALPEARSSLDAAVLGNKVYVFGGWKLAGDSDSSQWHTTAWSLDLSDAAAKWKPVAAPPFQRRAVSVAAFQGKLFVVGGMQAVGGPTTNVNVYDPKTDKWQDGPALPGKGMSGFGSASFACAGNLYTTTMDGFVHVLNESQDGWKTVAEFDEARFFHRMLPLKDERLVMLGGANMEIGKFTEILSIEVGKTK